MASDPAYSSLASTAETLADFRGEQDRWKREIDFAEKQNVQWVERCRAIDRRYQDDRDASEKSQRRYNVLWSNVMTLGPALYAKPPVPSVARRWQTDDPVARQAGLIAERGLIFEQEQCKWDTTWKSCVTDYLLFARGTPWVRYEADVKGEDVGEQGIYWDRVHYPDFLHNPARDWSEVTWVARRLFLTRAALVARFGERGKECPLDYAPRDKNGNEIENTPDIFKKAMVWEIWDKESRRAVWMCPSWGADDMPLDVKPDPLKLRDFFPCPRPLFGTLGSSSLIPVPDYVEYQDQARELDELTERISLIVSAVKMAGVYAGGADIVVQMLNSQAENKLWPVDQWAMFAEKGGLKGVIEWLPLDMMAAALTALYAAFEQKKQQLYEITGISDIVRGQAEGGAKTATEQRIKGQFASLRIRDRQQDVQNFIRDCVAIAGEIMSEHFTPANLAAMADMKLPDPAAMAMMGHNGGPSMIGGAGPGQPGMAGVGFPPSQPASPMTPGAMPDPSAPSSDPALTAAAIELLKSDRQRTMRIGIETDSTVQPDEAASQQAAVEFLTSFGALLKDGLPLVMQVPSAAPMMGEIMSFLARRFKAATTLEEAIDRFAKDMAAQAQQAAQQPKTDPEAEANIAATQAETSAKVQGIQATTAAKIQGAQAKAQTDAQLELRKQNIDAMLGQQRIQADANRPEVIVQ